MPALLQPRPKCACGCCILASCWSAMPGRDIPPALCACPKGSCCCCCKRVTWCCWGSPWGSIPALLQPRAKCAGGWSAMPGWNIPPALCACPKDSSSCCWCCWCCKKASRCCCCCCTRAACCCCWMMPREPIPSPPKARPKASLRYTASSTISALACSSFAFFAAATCSSLTFISSANLALVSASCLFRRNVNSSDGAFSCCSSGCLTFSKSAIFRSSSQKRWASATPSSPFERVCAPGLARHRGRSCC